MQLLHRKRQHLRLPNLPVSIQPPLPEHDDLLANGLEGFGHHQPAYAELLVLGIAFGVVKVSHHRGAGDHFVDEVGHLGEDFGAGWDGH